MINWKYEKPHPRAKAIEASHRSGIYENKPWTTGDNLLVDDLPVEVRENVLAWVRQSVLPSSYVNPHRTSYGIKHLLQHETGIYLTNNQFKDAMLLCGFLPANRTKIDWEYRIKERSPAFIRERERNYGGVVNK